jgi:hypothetical protein
MSSRFSRKNTKSGPSGISPRLSAIAPMNPNQNKPFSWSLSPPSGGKPQYPRTNSGNCLPFESGSQIDNLLIAIDRTPIVTQHWVANMHPSAPQ